MFSEEKLSAPSRAKKTKTKQNKKNSNKVLI